ncbi:MAG: type II toxin-antitoxin system Phd/YefM family antitoxin [Verrucomicrobiaceae bacterium]|nr:MAG: type II toxin-antitoxin system Phd/YefM family antitoxin [Verrucomicrobiaceae bacterium]
MMTVELSELSLHLGDFIERVKAGETVVIRDADRTIAELRPAEKKELRPFGLCKGEFIVPDSFFDPLPEDLVKAFNGE